MVLLGSYKHLLFISSIYQGLVQSMSFYQGLNWLAIIYLFKVRNRNTRKRSEICLKLIKTPEQRISHHFLVFLLLTLSK